MLLKKCYVRDKITHEDFESIKNSLIEEKCEITHKNYHVCL